jgi:hypothetical protein
MSPPASYTDFARAFGDALVEFLHSKEMTQSEAARQLGLESKKGKARLNTYCHDSQKGHRTKPDAEILYLLCTKLGFNFEYMGYKISAATLNGNGSRPTEKPAEQLTIQFGGQFNLTDQNQKRTVAISVRRPPGRIEIALLLGGTS